MSQTPTPVLTIAIATMGPRSAAIALPDPDPEITYLIVVQTPPQALSPMVLRRPDVEVVEVGSIGLSRSRNEALERVKTPLMLIADDDLSFNVAGIHAAMEDMHDDPDIAIQTGILEDEQGVPLKAYPRARCDWTRFNSGKIGSPEIMIRVAQIKEKNIWFQPEFGVGSTWPSGEEFIFVTDALKAGMKVVFAPHAMAAHPRESTGSNWSEPGLVEARKQTLRRVFGKLSLPVRMIYAWRKRHLLGISGAIRFGLLPPSSMHSERGGAEG